MLKKALAMALAIMLMLAFMPASVMADNTNVSMTVVVGYGGMYVVDKVTPVLVTIKNDGKEIAGTIELRTGTGFSLLVSRDVVLPQNTEKRFVLFVQTSAIYKPKDFEVLLKSNGAKILSAIPATVSGIDPDKALCGILSDDPAAVAYMKKIIFNQGVLTSKDWVDLNADNLYETAGLLDAFDVIVINRFDVGKLTDLQRAAIQQWVYGGGQLILGTGPGSEATAVQWKELVNGLTIGGSDTATDLKELASLGQGKVFNGSLPIISIKSEGWKTVAKGEADKPLIVQKLFGKGAVFVTSFDLGEGVMGAWEGNSLLWQTLLSGLTSKNSNNGYGIQYGMFGMYGESGGMQTALQAGLAGGDLTFWFFMLLLVLFIALVGFGSFAILRHMGKQTFMWAAVPVLAVLFSGLLLFCGHTSLGRKPYTFAFTSTDISGGVSVSNNSLAFVAPAMGDYTLSADEPNFLFPQDNVDNSYNMAPGVNLPPKQPVTAIMQADSAELKYLNVNLNGSRIARFSTFSQKAPLELSYIYDGNDVTCKVKNISNWTIEDFAIMIGANNKVIGELVPGAEKEIKLPLDQTPLDQSFWGLVDQMYPNNYNGGIFPVNNKSDKEKSIKAAFLREQANNFSNTTGTVSTNALGQAFCFGWVSKPFEYAIKVNGQTQKPTSLELITALSPITQQNDGSAKLEIVKSYAQLNTSLTTSTSVTMRGDVISIEPGNTAVMDFNLSIASTLAITDMFLESGMQQGMSATWSIYNWNTNAWDATDPKHRFTQDTLSKYIDSTGLVRLRVSVGSNDYAEGMPYIWVQGVRK